MRLIDRKTEIRVQNHRSPTTRWSELNALLQIWCSIQNPKTLEECEQLRALIEALEEKPMAEVVMGTQKKSEAMEDLKAEIIRLRAEERRLRSTLRIIATAWPSQNHAAAEDWRELRGIARRALEHTANNQEDNA